MVPGPLVLSVDDEPNIRRLLRAALTTHGYRSIECGSASDAWRFLKARNPDLLLLDLGLPDGDGVDFARQMRPWSAIPIIVISGRGGTRDIAEALDAGADDYLVKPFCIDELLARMRASLRRSQGVSPELGQVFQFDQLRIDLARREVTQQGKSVQLTPTEYKVLALFARHAGKVLTHMQILESVWGQDHEYTAHHVRVHLAELRKKIEADPAHPTFLITEPGVGYRLRDRGMVA